MLNLHGDYRLGRYGRLWASEWKLNSAEINEICMVNPNFLDLEVLEISAFLRTDRQKDGHG